MGEPVSVSFGALYNPHIQQPWVGANTYIPVSKLDSSGLFPALIWNTYTELNLLCDDHSTYFNDTYTHSFATDRCDLTCTFDVTDNWVRQLTYYRDELDCPVVRYRDVNDDPGDSIFTLHMMAKNAVIWPGAVSRTPTGTPGTYETHPVVNGLPGTVYSIANGDHWQFEGQWGVSWDVYYFGPAAEAMIGLFKHYWHPSEEQGQFYAETGIYPFEEEQYILRIKTAGPCDTVVVPYRTRPAGLNVTQTTGGLNLVTTATIGSPRFLAD